MSNELKEFAAELQHWIQEYYGANPMLRDLWLRITEQEIERVRKEDRMKDGFL